MKLSPSLEKFSFFPYFGRNEIGPLTASLAHISFEFASPMQCVANPELSLSLSLSTSPHFVCLSLEFQPERVVIPKTDIFEEISANARASQQAEVRQHKIPS
jgi:hypothetical protein